MSADTTPTTLDTFCPAKWDEVVINTNYNWVHGCCKATPIKFVKNYNEVLDVQKSNLLNGIQDPSCNYCWSVENAGGKSLRHFYTQSSTVENYLNNPGPKALELNLGNECNFQCLYCNPKFSSKWEKDVSTKPYPIFTDRVSYHSIEKNPNSTNTDILKEFPNLEKLHISGGEPLYNKGLWDILDQTTSPELLITTNLSCKIETIDRLLGYSKFKKIRIQVSLDATGKLAEFIRYGLDFETLVSNVQFILDKNLPNVELTIISLMTSLSIRDVLNLSNLVDRWKVRWLMFYCKDPVIHSFYTLPDVYRDDAYANLAQVNALGKERVISALDSYKFKPGAYKELKMFVDEFSKRKKIEIPICLN